MLPMLPILVRGFAWPAESQLARGNTLGSIRVRVCKGGGSPGYPRCTYSLLVLTNKMQCPEELA